MAIPWIVQAQVTINVVIPPAGILNKDQLWNVVLTNNTNSVRDVNLLLNLQDAATGQSVLSAGTTNIVLSKGVKVITPRDVQPVQYNYGMSGFAGKFLPLGNYVACFSVTQYGAEKTQNLATECIRINIAPLSPPLLNQPANKSVLSLSTPQLSWVPPAPLDMFDDLNYDLNVAEVMQGQSPTEAILYNTPLLNSARLKLPYETYPSTYSKLEAGKTYAWQVTARNGGQYAAVSEVWSFSIAGDSMKVKTDNVQFIELKPGGETSGTYFAGAGRLNIKYYSFDKAHEVTVRFLDKERKPLQQLKQKVQYGDNYLSFSLNQRYSKGETYIIELTDRQNKVYSAIFSIK